MFDDDRANHHAGIFGRTASLARERLVIGFSQLIPGNNLAQFDPTIVLIERRLERPVKFGQGKLFVAGITNHGARLLLVAL
ncbi:hypothetical protein [Thiolapillus sp.]|uniref:hypothetical protein n=1 Tax=Thiolapillus sp. TaxID=2017437 RepID=UPI0035A97A52